MGTSSCERCGGSRHLWSGRRYVACECLRRERTVATWRRAGIPPRFEDASWRDLVRDWRVSHPSWLLRTALRLRSGASFGEGILLLGSPSEGRDLALALLLCDACEGGREVAWFDLPRLIDAEFRREEGLPEPSRIYRTGVLALSIGAEPNHKWNRIVLERALRTRWESRLPTVVSSSVEPERLGTRYGSAAVEEGISRLVRVEIRRAR